MPFQKNVWFMLFNNHKLLFLGAILIFFSPAVFAFISIKRFFFLFHRKIYSVYTRLFIKYFFIFSINRGDTGTYLLQYLTCVFHFFSVLSTPWCILDENKGKNKMMRRRFQWIEIRVLLISSKENKAEKRETIEFILTSDSLTKD